MKLALIAASLLALVAPNTQTNCTGASSPCFGVSVSPGGTALQGSSNGGGYGIGVSAQRGGSGGVALQALGNGGMAVYAQGNPAIVASSTSPGNPLLYVGKNPHATIFHVDSMGNGYFAGKIVGKHEAVQPTSAGVAVTTYASQASEATLEDFGETPLVAGSAYVRLDPRFASAMADDRYLVFVTPQGRVDGNLYVTQKTRAGFAIRETSASRSTALVDYRIVAHPLGADTARMPLAKP